MVVVGGVCGVCVRERRDPSFFSFFFLFFFFFKDEKWKSSPLSYPSRSIRK